MSVNGSWGQIDDVSVTAPVAASAANPWAAYWAHNGASCIICCKLFRSRVILIFDTEKEKFHVIWYQCHFQCFTEGWCFEILAVAYHVIERWALCSTFWNSYIAAIESGKLTELSWPSWFLHPPLSVKVAADSLADNGVLYRELMSLQNQWWTGATYAKLWQKIVFFTSMPTYVAGLLIWGGL